MVIGTKGRTKSVVVPGSAALGVSPWSVGPSLVPAGCLLSPERTHVGVGLLAEDDAVGDRTLDDAPADRGLQSPLLPDVVRRADLSPRSVADEAGLSVQDRRVLLLQSAPGGSSDRLLSQRGWLTLAMVVTPG